MNLTVECYSGRKADERPIRFRIEGRQYEVKAVVDQWYEPDSISYKVKADDENFYILRENHAAELQYELSHPIAPHLVAIECKIQDAYDHSCNCKNDC